MEVLECWTQSVKVVKITNHFILTSKSADLEGAMVQQITVFLIRNGETLDEVVPDPDDEDDQVPILRLAQKVDPPLSTTGHLQSAVVLTNFLKALVAETPTDSVRRLAAFSAPFRSCTGTALMMCCAGLHAQDKLRWRYTTVSAAESPTAIPIIVVNGLCNQVPEISRLGGAKSVVNAGLLHCAAEPFNDGREKCPFMKIVTKEWKECAQEPVKEWKNERGVDEVRRVIDVQYLRIENQSDPWSLQDLTPQINLIVDMLEPNKYLYPPRKGGFEKKIGSSNILKKELEIGPDLFVKESILKARQVGCDTVLLFVPTIAIEKILAECTDNPNPGLVPEASCIATVFANIDDSIGDNGESITFKYFGYSSADDVMSDPAAVIPDFTGPVDVLIPPPEGKDPDSVPPNQWSKFPLPQPEVIPDDYPDL